MKRIILSGIVSFDWDDGNLWHIKKHKVEYSESEEIFYDEPVFFTDEKHSLHEKRYAVYGLTDENRLLVIIFTIRKSKIRIISARDSNKKEKAIYKNKKMRR